jgi:glycosyltransferase involved in cell wall biosynthesis
MISIVIPCYNAAATLRATLKSALAQDCDKEIIVIDDGSTDHSADIIRSFGEEVRSETTPNRGASAARNRGTALARGRFLQYLDSDDLLMPGTLGARRAALEKAGADVAHTDWQKLHETEDGGTTLGEIVRPDVERLERDAELATATSAFWAPPAALLYSRRIVERVGSWSMRLPIIQDARFLFDAAAQGARFVYIPGVGAHYRVSHTSLSRRNVGRFLADCAVNAREIEKLWRDRGDLSSNQCGALADMWGHVATASLLNGAPPFETARASYNQVGPRRALLEIGFVARKALGPAQAAAALQFIRRGRGSVRSFLDLN